MFEVFYNITNGIISISNKGKIKISKYKSIVRIHYNFMKKNIWKSNSAIFHRSRDTDSLIYEIETQDLKGEIGRHRDLFDLSNYQSNHILHDDTNKKMLLKFKNETAGKTR